MEQIFKAQDDSQATVEEDSTKKSTEHSVCFIDCPSGGQPDHKNAQLTVRSTASIGFPELLTDKEVEVEHENVQNTVRSMAEYCTEFKRRNDRAVALLWEDISVTTADGAKVLLKNASGMIKSRFLAIMGPSGSGKTTLMNVLARRMGGAKMDGVSKINGIPYSNAELKTLSGYVMQDDLLNGNLTVQETLDFTAELRLPSTMTAEERKVRVDEAIHKVGLNLCRNTIIGTPTIKGVSGGERKRVCVAMELLTHPRLLFLDEPTSGLDSVTAYSLTKTLKDLAAAGDCTVVCTIHQPQTKIFNLFDDLMLLKAGLVVYYGPADKTVDFFAEAGFPCPPLTNPADHFLDVITPPASSQLTSVSHQHSDVDKALMRVFKPVNNKVEEEYEMYSDVFVHAPRSWGHQFSVLLRRCFLESTRSYAVIITLLAQNLVMALLIGGAFFQIGKDANSQIRRQPLLFFTVINQGIFSALSVINSFPSERLLVLRERAAGTYQVSAYFLAKNVADALIQLPGPIIFSCIVYWMVGLQAEAGKFFIFLAFMILTSMASTSLALMVSALARTTTLAVTILPMILEVSRLFGGFFLSPVNLPKYFVWLDALSYVKYAYVAVSLNEQSGLEIDCQGSGSCRDGQATIDFLGLDRFTIGSCAGILIAMIIIFRVIAYVGIRFIKW